jgi:aspartate aminotransferase
MQLASRLNRVSEPQTIRMAKLSRALKNEGHNIIDLSLGEPDFNTPAHICDAATAAMAAGFTKYTAVAGLLELRQAICEKLRRDNQVDYTPEQIVVTTGAKQSIANAVLCLVNPGDEVIIPTPYWVTYSSLDQFAEGVVRFVPCGIDAHFKLRPEQLEAAITPRTKLLMFSSPCNPSGSVYSQEELAALVAVLDRYPHVSILSDEIYEYINYRGRHHSIAAFPQIKDRVILINGFSKGFAMTGWRLGYMAAPLELAQACDRLQGQFTSGANAIAQRAAIVALNSSMEPTYAMARAFKERCHFVIDALSAMPGVSVTMPDGAFYAFPDISAFLGRSAGTHKIETDEDLAMYLLHEANVSTVCGSAFGAPQCLRISFATSMENLEEAMKRLSVAFASLR